MTEQEWLACTDPTPMFEFLLGRVSDRKLRLFACGCCRRICHLLVDERSRRVIEAAEQFIEGDVNREVLATAINAANEASNDVTASGTQAESEAAIAASKAGICARITAEDFNRDAWIYAAEDLAWHVRYALETEGGEQAALLRDVFGPLLFHPVFFDVAWLTWNDGVVKKIARAVYDDRAFDRLPLLADALEEAGCDDADILDHLRGPGPHVRGCWVVDLILGKE